MNKKNTNMKYSENDKKNLEPDLDLEKEKIHSEIQKQPNSNFNFKKNK